MTNIKYTKKTHKSSDFATFYKIKLKNKCKKLRHPRSNNGDVVKRECNPLGLKPQPPYRASEAYKKKRELDTYAHTQKKAHARTQKDTIILNKIHYQAERKTDSLNPTGYPFKTTNNQNRICIRIIIRIIIRRRINRGKKK